ncbi:MAG: Holliday junction branch migration protein RuvA [Pseudomonadota bacterium]
MIGRIQGTLLSKTPPQLLVDCHGVGYEIEAPMTTIWALPDINETVTLLTHLVVRDDAHLLFGFATEAERALFRSLLKVSGIGAKVALAILSGIETEEFIRCVNAGDSARLTALPGIGKKTAERLVVEMRDRVADLPEVTVSSSTNQATVVADPANDAVSGLIALGYKPAEASKLIHALEVDGKSSEDLIREALKNFA